MQDICLLATSFHQNYVNIQMNSTRRFYHHAWTYVLIRDTRHDAIETRDIALIHFVVMHEFKGYTTAWQGSHFSLATHIRLLEHIQIECACFHFMFLRA